MTKKDDMDQMTVDFDTFTKLLKTSCVFFIFDVLLFENEPTALMFVSQLSNSSRMKLKLLFV